MHSIATMQHGHNKQRTQHTVTTCTGYGPSVLVDRVRLGPSSGPPPSPVHCPGTCTGRTSQCGGHTFECTARRANLIQCHRAAPSHARAVPTFPKAEEAVGGPQLSPQPVRDEAMPARCAKSALRHACHCAQIVFRRVTDPGYVPALAPPVDLPVNTASPQCRLYVGSCMLENSSVMPETSVKPFLGRPRAPQTFYTLARVPLGSECAVESRHLHRFGLEAT